MTANHSLFSYIAPLIAHRGASALAPENTLAAFRKAGEMGAKWVEFDVMLATCGEVVVIHDETLDRTTNGTGFVSEYPYSYLQTLDAGSWFNRIYAGEKIPTLAAVIDLLYQYRLVANIEIKPAIGREEETVKRVLAVIAKHWRADMRPPLISSFSRIVLEYIRKYSTKHFLAYLIDEWQPDWKLACDELDCVSVDVNQKILDQAKVAEIQATNRLVLSYTIDQPQRAKELFSLGVNAVFSNCPPAMCLYL